MDHSNEQQDRIHRLIDQVLREQPLRRAPSTLQSRVFTELSRRSSMPWWRKSFGSWPLAARAAFLIASYGFIEFALAGVMWLMAALRAIPFEAALNPAVTWIHAGSSLISEAGKTSALVFHAIPQPWLYGAIASGIVLYVALFGIVATAYRVLYSPR